MKNFILLSTFFLFAIPNSRGSTVDLCDRGKIGKLIAEQVGISFSLAKIFSPDCAKVDKEKMSNLIYLDLSNKEIKEIPHNSFAGLDSLTALWLNDNQIITIEKDSFSGLDHLKALWLDGNQITTIEEGSFSGLDSLKSLWLNDNQITSLEKNTFAGLHNLQALWLDGNQLTSIHKDTFVPLQNLVHWGLPILPTADITYNQ